MVDCRDIIKSEGDKKYFLLLHFDKNTYEFYSEIKMERDKWFEILNNSIKNAKIYKYSKTKNPYNVNEYNNLLAENEKNKENFEDKIIYDLFKKTGNIDEISEFGLFKSTIQDAEKFIESKMDGCICIPPIKKKLLKEYSESMNKVYLDIFQLIWDKYYNIFNDEKEKIIEMGF